MMAQTTLIRRSLTTVSIIGSAGRRADAKKMTTNLYWNMVDKSLRVIAEQFKLDPNHVHLVSGGAAWADHVAVTLFLEQKVAALTLHIPAAWESAGCRFEDNGKSSQSNPGRVANKLHKAFGGTINENTLQQIESCKLLGAKLQVHNGFKKRNDSVAMSDYLIAFSWSEGEEPTKGGTLDTWNKCAKKKLHIPLSSLENCTRETTREEPSVSGLTERDASVELLGSQHTTATHVEQPKPPLSPGHSSQKLPSSSTPNTNPFPSSSQPSSLQSLDSGIESLDSSQPTESKVPEIVESNRKRKRSESTDISDYSDHELDDKAAKLYSQQPNSKKLKVSDFANHALSS